MSCYSSLNREPERWRSERKCINDNNQFFSDPLLFYEEHNACRQNVYSCSNSVVPPIKKTEKTHESKVQKKTNKENSASVISCFSLQSSFKEFTAEYALKKASMPKTGLVWSYYHINPNSNNHEDKSVSAPLIFIPGLCGNCSVFFLQLKALSSKGYEVISCEYPSEISTISSFCESFDSFLDFLEIKSCHIFGEGLGGFLALHFAVNFPRRVLSLILYNSFNRTDIFVNIAIALRGVYASFFTFLPHAVLKKIIFNSLFIKENNEINEQVDTIKQTDNNSSSICVSNKKINEDELKTQNANEFINHTIDYYLTSTHLGNRLNMQIAGKNVTKSLGADLLDGKMTLIFPFYSSLPSSARYYLTNTYRNARLAELKSGGNFAFLSHADEVTLFIEVHLRKCSLYPKNCLDNERNTINIDCQNNYMFYNNNLYDSNMFNSNNSIYENNVI